MKKGTTVLVTYGYNKVLNRPFEFLYDFGYEIEDDMCIVYNHGEQNMQDAHCFPMKNIKVASDEDIKNNFWGN